MNILQALSTDGTATEADKNKNCTVNLFLLRHLTLLERPFTEYSFCSFFFKTATAVSQKTARNCDASIRWICDIVLFAYQTGVGFRFFHNLKDYFKRPSFHVSPLSTSSWFDCIPDSFRLYVRKDPRDEVAGKKSDWRPSVDTFRY